MQVALNYEFSDLVKNLLSKKVCFAIWRLPHQKNVSICISDSDNLTEYSLSDGLQTPGFAMAKFENEGKMCLISPVIYENDWSKLDAQWFEKPTEGSTKEYQKLADAPKADFQKTVKRAIEEIEKGRFFKVVVSRYEDYLKPADFDVALAFQKLSDQYSHAFVSLVAVPAQNECWLGASPELLASQDAHGIFRTMALAGTQKSTNAEGAAIEPKNAFWRQKEIEEQALVSRYIIDCFKTIRLREFEEEGPRTALAGNLLHLKTDFWVDTQANRIPELLELMVPLLHPTSAVCGMPKDAAFAFLKENECYDRSLYSGFLGPLHLDHGSKLFVNLRTSKITAQNIRIFAGCGITADSDPELEYTETQLKIATIKDVIL